MGKTYSWGKYKQEELAEHADEWAGQDKEAAFRKHMADYRKGKMDKHEKKMSAAHEAMERALMTGKK